MQVIVACFGNVLRGDDGFGIAVGERLRSADVPEGVRVLEIGIGGIRLVQELLDGVDALVVVDAVDVGRPPGTIVVLDPDVADVSTLPVNQRRDALADMHLATPERAFTLARGMGVLPPVVLIVGAQAADAERYGEGMTAAVAASVDVAAAEVRRTVTGFGVVWD